MKGINNMARINKPEEIFTKITEDLRDIFKDDLISIMLYGSGTGMIISRANRI